MQKLNSGGGSPYANHLTTGRRRYDSASEQMRLSALECSHDRKPPLFLSVQQSAWLFRSIMRVCLTIGMQKERNQKVPEGECWRLPVLLFITSHFYFSHRDTRFTPWESSKFFSSLWNAIGRTLPTWQDLIGWHRERDVRFEKTDGGRT